MKRTNNHMIASRYLKILLIMTIITGAHNISAQLVGSSSPGTIYNDGCMNSNYYEAYIYINGPQDAEINKVDQRFNPCYVLDTMKVDITHGDVGDIIMTMEYNGSKDIARNLGGNGANFTNTRFVDDGIAPSITTGSPPFSNVYTPQFGSFNDVYKEFEYGFSGFVIRICDDDPTGTNGTLDKFEISLVPTNDVCDNATLINPGGSNYHIGSNQGARNNIGPICGSDIETGKGVWYKFTGNGNAMGLTTNDNSGSNTNFDTEILVYTGSCASLSCLGGNDNIFNGYDYSGFALMTTQDQEYFVYVDGHEDQDGTFRLTLEDCNAGFSYDNVNSSSSAMLDTVKLCNDSNPYKNQYGGRFTAVPEGLSITEFEGDIYFYGSTKGTYTVTHTLPNGCQEQIMVNIDDIPPVALCNDITIELYSESVTISEYQIDDNSSDGCGINYIELSKNTFDCGDLGIQKVVLTVEDNSGNTSSCIANVTVVPPPGSGFVNDVKTVTNTSNSGSGSLRYTVSDACSGDTITFDHSSGMVDGPIMLSDSIVLDKNLVFLGIDSAKTIIDGSNGNFSLFLLRDCAEVEFRDMTFRNGGGTGILRGGAIESTGANNINKLDIVNCQFISNEVDLTTFTAGGAILSVNAETNIFNSRFYANKSLFVGGGIYHSGSELLTVYNCVFEKNDCIGLGAAIGIASSDGEIVNNVIVDNTSRNSYDAVYAQYSDLTLANNIFKENDGNLSISGGTIQAFNNLLDDYTGTPLSPGTGGNLLGDPMFRDQANGDYRLRSGSPAINAGSNAYIPTDGLDVDGDNDSAEDVDIDRRGALRIMDAHVDMGAYELVGDECESAVRIACGDVLMGDAGWQDEAPIQLEDCDNLMVYNYYRTNWFTFTGTGDTVKIKVFDYTVVNSSLEMHLYSGSCGSFTCVDGEGKYFDEPMADSIEITTQAGTEYYLMLGIYQNASDVLGTFSLSMECICGADPLTYSPPHNFTNGDNQLIETNSTIAADNHISASADIEYNGKQGVMLNQGFEVKKGALFHAYTDGCTPPPAAYQSSEEKMQRATIEHQLHKKHMKIRN